MTPAWGATPLDIRSLIESLRQAWPDTVPGMHRVRFTSRQLGLLEDLLLLAEEEGTT
jgi:hypothetical protein